MRWSSRPLPAPLLLGADRNRVRAGAANITTTPHVDPHNNVFVQLAGHKRFRLSPPADLFAFAPYPATHPHARQAQRPLLYDEAPSSIRTLTVTLRPGEMLWLPALWVHEVHAVTATISASIVAPTADSAFFDRFQDGGLETIFPFVEGNLMGWDLPRVHALTPCPR